MRNPQADFEAEKHEEKHKKTIYPKITIFPITTKWKYRSKEYSFWQICFILSEKHKHSLYVNKNPYHLFSFVQIRLR